MFRTTIFNKNKDKNDVKTTPEVAPTSSGGVAVDTMNSEDIVIDSGSNNGIVDGDETIVVSVENAPNNRPAMTATGDRPQLTIDVNFDNHNDVTTSQLSLHTTKSDESLVLDLVDQQEFFSCSWSTERDPQQQKQQNRQSPKSSTKDDVTDDDKVPTERTNVTNLESPSSAAAGNPSPQQVAVATADGSPFLSLHLSEVDLTDLPPSSTTSSKTGEGQNIIEAVVEQGDEKDENEEEQKQEASDNPVKASLEATNVNENGGDDEQTAVEEESLTPAPTQASETERFAVLGRTIKIVFVAFLVALLYPARSTLIRSAFTGGSMSSTNSSPLHHDEKSFPNIQDVENNNNSSHTWWFYGSSSENNGEPSHYSRSQAAEHANTLESKSLVGTINLQAYSPRLFGGTSSSSSSSASGRGTPAMTALVQPEMEDMTFQPRLSKLISVAALLLAAVISRSANSILAHEKASTKTITSSSSQSSSKTELTPRRHTRQSEPTDYMTPLKAPEWNLSSYESLKVTDLRQMLRDRDVSTSGQKKEVLINRLVMLYQTELATLTTKQIRPVLKRHGLKQVVGEHKIDTIRRLVEVGPLSTKDTTQH